MTLLKAWATVSATVVISVTAGHYQQWYVALCTMAIGSLALGWLLNDLWIAYRQACRADGVERRQVPTGRTQQNSYS